MTAALCHVRAVCVTGGCASVCFPGLRRAEVQWLCFKPRMPRTRRKGAGDAAGTAKESQAETMQTQVEITEQGSKECEKRTSAQKGTTWLTVLPGYRGRPCHGRPCYPGTEAARVTADRVTRVPRGRRLLAEPMPLRLALGFWIAIIAYLVLHELVHGAAYKFLTGQKLTFGITLSVAFCGVPEIYVYRRASLIAVLAPFVVFTLLGVVLLAVFPGAWTRFFLLIFLGLHIGGCSGDLYNTWSSLNILKRW